ncbi:tRNA (adenosine(37)-N6)-threonylcarbamoyltransferase complex dimerization subunit type 1 TsaB [Vulcanococcus limneticus]|uniref:tRNA (adenosine(37)-N6)-threonylcarbamoyltransferase complex dimerization subunit type 1 TsaB n=1 Tax=Vulcanococcus limneticus TaxID=2170428 RepID=UPI00398BE639
MSASPWLLALHSSSDTLAVGLQRLAAGTAPEPARLAGFPLGRQLSNELLPCVEELLPAEQWPQLGRLVVATGPGGFTGTRLTLVLARTLAQQLAIPLHGFSSFLLIARRLAAPGGAMAGAERFWLTQELPRRGVVAGAYGPDPAAFGGVAEWEPPRLFPPGEALPAGPRAQALVEPEADAAQLLALGQLAAARHLAGPWQPVLPLYPTSPVEGL